jgi:hypothetical protein
MKEKRISKGKGRTFAVIAAAAAMMTTGTIAAGAYSAAGNNIWNGLRTAFGSGFEQAPEKLPEESRKALESVTARGGTLVRNTFAGTEVAFEGIVTDKWITGDETQSFAVFTLRKTDGTAFAEPDAGFRYTAASADGVTDNEGYKFDSANVERNADGSLSVTFHGFIKGSSAPSLRFSLINICLGAESGNAIAAEGEMVFETDPFEIPDKAAVGAAEYHGGKVSASVSPVRIIISGENGSFADIDELPDITVNYGSGKSDKLGAVGFTEENGEWKAIYEQAAPFDVNDIESVEFDGVKIKTE